jgi:hypothetical protein
LKQRLIRADVNGYEGWEAFSTPQVIEEIEARIARWKDRESGMELGIANWCLINFLVKQKTVSQLAQDFIEEEPIQEEQQQPIEEPEEASNTQENIQEEEPSEIDNVSDEELFNESELDIEDDDEEGEEEDNWK